MPKFTVHELLQGTAQFMGQFAKKPNYVVVERFVVCGTVVNTTYK